MPSTHFTLLRWSLPALCLTGLLLTGGRAASAQAVSGPLTTLHAFSALDPQSANPDGADPQAALVRGPDGLFYGTTSQGGPNGTGTIFRVAADGTLTTVYAFTARDTFGNNLDGAGPTSLILGGDGSLYGVTGAGGVSGVGTVFQVTTSGALTTLYSFSGSDGQSPTGPLVQGQDGALYGTTASGGANDNGTVFRLSAGGLLTTLHDFTATDPFTLVNSDGANPSAGLILGQDARLYGTAATGGPESAGTVFALATDGTGFTVLHAFSATGDAAQPQGALLQTPDGTLYGTAVYGGAAGNGAIFQISPGGAYGLLYSFGDFTPGFFGQNTDGANPEAGLIQGRDGALYGTTSSGGANSTGTLFQVTTSGVLMPLYAFGAENGTPSPDGANPESALVQGLDGNLYGTAVLGGPDDEGTVFRLIPDTSPPATTASVAGPQGANGWYTGPVTVTLTATDPDGAADVAATFASVDGAAAQPYTAPVPISGDAVHTLTFFSVDRSGNWETTQTLTVKIDGTAPAATAASAPTATGAQVTLSATDNLSGVASTAYSVDGGAAQTYDAPFAVTGNGTHAVTYQSTDAAGNVEAPQTLTVTVAIAAPVTTASVAGPAGSNGWYTGPVTVTLAARSAASVVAATYYTVDGGSAQTYAGPFAVSGDAVHTVSFHSVDQASNRETPHTVTVKIDGTAPVTTGAVSGAQVTLTASDALAGVTGTIYSVDSGAAQPYSAPLTVTGAGHHTVTFYSTDNAGNAEVPHSVALDIAPAVLHTFQPGLQMISAPEDFSTVPADQAWDQPGLKLLCWDPAQFAYLSTPTAPADTLHLGGAYWVRLTQPLHLMDVGAPAPQTAAFTVSLRRGWNMVGNPFAVAVLLSQLAVRDGSGSTQPWAGAVQNGLVGATVYGYGPGDTAYQPQTAAGGALHPYAGDRVRAMQDCTLVVPAPGQAPPPLAPGPGVKRRR